MHHITRAAIIAVAVVVLYMILNEFASRLVTFAYLGASGFFAWKAYNGEDVSIEILDSVEDKINKQIKK